jgi:hypothetical protein
MMGFAPFGFKLETEKMNDTQLIYREKLADDLDIIHIGTNF